MSPYDAIGPAWIAADWQPLESELRSYRYETSRHTWSACSLCVDAACACVGTDRKLQRSVTHHLRRASAVGDGFA
jgi:hypothetical protein